MLIRALIFKGLFYGLTALWVIVLSLTLLWPNYKAVYWGLSFWSDFVTFMLRVITGIKVEVRGLENRPANGPYIVCPKHQSTMDAFLAIKYVPYATALAKKELFFYPILGLLLYKLGILPVLRDKGTAHKKLPDMEVFLKESKRPILVFPEGTRVPSGERRQLKAGAFHIHEATGLPVITGATNAGYFWPAHEWTMRPGTIIWELHPPLPEGLDKDAFMAEIQKQVIDRSEELARDAATALNAISKTQGG